MEVFDIIKAENVSLGYNQTVIASKITLSIQPGEFIGIFGSNGSGKTTFIRTLLGLIKPVAGNLFIFNAKPTHGNDRIGYMPQLRMIASVAHLTSRTIIGASINSACYGLPILSKKQKSEITNILKLVEAESFADRPFQQLSGGERQRVYLAQSLQGYPPILLLDEPLAGLDPRSQERFIELLYRIKTKLNSTILLTAHDPNPLLKVMDRVLYFANGHAAIGQTKEIMTSENLSALYGLTIDVVHYKDRLIILGENQNLSDYHD